MKYIEVIKQVMQNNNLSQQKLGEMLGVNQTTVSQWLLGNKKPNYDSILAFCETFDIEPNTFFGFDEK